MYDCMVHGTSKRNKWKQKRKIAHTKLAVVTMDIQGNETLIHKHIQHYRLYYTDIVHTTPTPTVQSNISLIVEDLILVVLVGFQIIIPHVFVLSGHFIYAFLDSLCVCCDAAYALCADNISSRSFSIGEQQAAANELLCATVMCVCWVSVCLYMVHRTLVIQTEKLL